jgi:phenylacetate-CoA ligase
MPRGLYDRAEPPESLRRHFGAGSDDPIENWPALRLRAYQTEMVAEQLEHAYVNNPFYRQKFDRAGVRPSDFRNPEDLSRFPLTDKDELRGDPWVLLAVPRKDVRLAHTSTGTTGGRWSYILYSEEDMYVRDAAPFPHLLMPVREGDVVVNALPYEMSSSGQSFQRSLQGAAGALVVPVGKGGFYSDPYKTVQIMADLRADVLITTPPYALLLSEIAAEPDPALGRGPLRLGEDLRPRFMWLTGEGCSPAYRRRVEEAWNCSGLVFYGSMECGPIGVECGAKSGCHLSAGHVYLEVIDPKLGTRVEPGQVGEVVCTVLQRRASPLIRYRTQDLATLDMTPCPCGVSFPRLNLRGRIADQVGQAAGESSVSPYLIEEVLYAQVNMGNNYQVYTDGPSLLVEAEWRGAGDRAAVRQRIMDLLRQRGVQADLTWVEHIPRVGGKTRRIRPLAERESLMASPSLLRKP